MASESLDTCLCPMLPPSALMVSLPRRRPPAQPQPLVHSGDLGSEGKPCTELPGTKGALQPPGSQREWGPALLCRPCHVAFGGMTSSIR